MTNHERIVDKDSKILVTGANGFIGARVVAALLHLGLTDVRCFVRPTSNMSRLNEVIRSCSDSKVEVVSGNLLSPTDCGEAARGVALILHLAAGIEKTYPGSFLNSVVTTRNLLDKAVKEASFTRIVNVSSLAVYSNRRIRRRGSLDETCAIEDDPVGRCEPYVYAKIEQDKLVVEYARKWKFQYVIVRPGVVYGPGKSQLTGRVGIDTFGVFLHLGGRNRIPLTYVDNCADAIVLAGITKGVEGETFNIVDDNLPTSREFLRMYKRNAKRFFSLSVPYRVFYLFSYLWERYSERSGGQLPPVFNRKRCAAYWKGNRYPNVKLKNRLEWTPKVPMEEGMKKYFAFVKERGAAE